MSEDKTTNHDKELVEETERKSHNVLQGKFSQENMSVASLRIEALKIATEMALKINHFEPNYSTHSDPLEALLKDVDIVHKIADRNLKYIMGEK